MPEDRRKRTTDRRKNASPPRQNPVGVLGTLKRQRGILGRFFGGGNLQIIIKNQPFEFDSVESFRTFLSGKTEIPASKMEEMLKRSDQQLQEEIKQLEQVESTITDRLASTIRDPRSVDHYLDDATMIRFTQDYDWRQIMFELSKQSVNFSEYKLEAVTFYQKYLRSRIAVAKEVLREHALRVTGQETPAAAQEPAEPGTSKLPDPEELFASTSCIDLSEFTDEFQSPSMEFTKLPRGRTVKVNISEINEIPIKLASRKFTIKIGDDRIELVSDKKERYRLMPGENLIGRSTKCSVVVSSDLVDVSRRHVIIEVEPGKTLHFTDISSSGTQLPGMLVIYD